MVDYTKPAYWDETYKRWKGGEALAEELRNAYTDGRVWKRLASQNPMAASKTSKAVAAVRQGNGLSSSRGRGDARQNYVTRSRQPQQSSSRNVAVQRA